ncbi:hypothetical protein AJ78_06531 [Emergomyces pasteurianus Ep9510]|uniref:AGC-kinase C-terminal domain-containing protein n=1 Tax=Emergomyces pasteurianus Ep9510 TaxID=1447872 RepID=A0A1J9Q9T8_9EURO|nr:hypothetical protein AJ78_06531 [Emergomyces pasteurianus Ep9510]
MPPSTVFSYLRRDHRRPSPPATSTSPTALPAAAPPAHNSHLPPQLPLPDSSSYSPKLANTIGEPASWFGPQQQQHHQHHQHQQHQDQQNQQQVKQQQLPPPSDCNNNINNYKYNNYSGKSEHVSDVKWKQDNTIAGSGRENIPSLSASPQNANIPSPPTVNLDYTRPQSAGNDHLKKSLASPDSQQQATMLRPDQHDSAVYSSKPTSPWKLTFGKNILSDSSKGSAGSTTSFSPGCHNNSSTRMKPSPPGYTSAEPTSSNSSSTFIPGRELAKLESHSNTSSFRRDVSSHDANHEHTAPRAGKTRLNLLNPMALLARRRSGQTLTPRLDDIGKGRLGLPALPDDYDPRIRGKLFHDFSAPRPRPNVPMMQQGPVNSQSGNAQDGQNNHNNNYNNNRPPAPLRKESLENENRGSLVVSDKGYPETSSSGPTASSGRPHSAVELYDTPLPLRQASTNKQQEQHASMRSNARSSSTRSKASMVHDGSFQPSGLPRHLTSNASRFSFDMASGDSASQERIMEEKHKQKEAAKRAKAQLDRSNDSDSEDFDYDAMMDDDGLEEKIPGINTDADAGDEFDGFMSQGHVFGPPGNQLFVPVLPTVMSNPMSPLDLNSSAPRSPEKDMPTPLMISPKPAFAGLDNAGAGGIPSSNIPLPTNAAFLQTGPGVGTVPSESSLQQPPPLFNQGVEEKSCFFESDEDDMYFDDGMIDDILEDIEGEKFDESVFDDETSHLYERKPKFKTQLPTLTGGDGTAVDDDQKQAKEHGVDDNDEDGKVPLVAQNSVIQRNASGKDERTHGEAGGISAQKMMHSTIRGLTEGNLEKYHSALAKAANEAALRGRFERSGSVSEQSSGAGSSPPSPDSHPGLTADDSRVSQNVDSMAFEEVFDDFDYNDDYLDDDPIIAAANAEALENDDEGFYGQEFGFYPQAVGNNCDNQMVLGGYFGTRGVEGITRSHSGRVNFQEPSLTPITERSEWSTRNSIISLTAHAVVAAGGPSAPLTSPSPLAHLGDMGSIDDQMNALMKLRRGAWGGSNGSLRSSAASQGQPGSSPVATTVAAGASSRGSFASFHDVLPEQGRCGSGGNSNNTMLAGSPVGMESNGYSNINGSQQHPHSSFMHTHSIPPRNPHQQQHHYQVDNDFSPLGTTSIYNYMVSPTEKEKPLSQSTYPEQRQPPQLPHSHHHLHHHLHHHHHHHHSHPSLDIDTDKANIAAATTAIAATSPYPKEDNINSSISQHSRANSTTESISYIKETDEAGGDRWVLERRRTSESGEREVVETEVLAGGII